MTKTDWYFAKYEIEKIPQQWKALKYYRVENFQWKNVKRRTDMNSLAVEKDCEALEW